MSAGVVGDGTPMIGVRGYPVAAPLTVPFSPPVNVLVAGRESADGLAPTEADAGLAGAPCIVLSLDSSAVAARCVMLAEAERSIGRREEEDDG